MTGDLASIADEMHDYAAKLVDRQLKGDIPDAFDVANMINSFAKSIWREISDE